MDTYKKYWEKVNDYKNKHRQKWFDEKKYNEYIKKVSESDIPRHLENIQILSNSINIKDGKVPENFPIHSIKEDYERIQKEQAETDKRRENLKNKSRLLYQICNIWSHWINALVSSTRWTWAKLWALVSSLWHDDDEMIAVWERANNWFWNPNIPISTRQAQSAYEKWEIILNWDNWPWIVSEWIVSMLTLVAWWWAITKWLTKWATKIWIGMWTKLARGTWLVSSGFIQQAWPSFGEWLSAWMTWNQAMLYAITSATLQWSLELLSPNEFINWLWKNLAKTYIKEILKSESKQSLKAVWKLFLKNVWSEIWEEIIQEEVQLAAWNIINMRANNQYDLWKNGLDSDWNPKNFAATALVTALTTGFVAWWWFAMKTPWIWNNQNREQLIWHIQKNNELHSDVMNVLDKAIAWNITIPNVNIQQLQGLKDQLNWSTNSETTNATIEWNNDYFNWKSHQFEVTEAQARWNSEMMDNLLNQINEQNQSKKLEELRKSISEQYEQATWEKLNLMDEQLLSILDAHEQDWKLWELTLWQLRQKVKILDETITDSKVRRFLLEAGFCGRPQEVHQNINIWNQNYEITYRWNYGEMKITNWDGTITNIDFWINGKESKHFEFSIEYWWKIENYTTIEQLCKISEEMWAWWKIWFEKGLIRNLDNKVEKQILERFINSENFSENAILYDKYDKRLTFNAFEKFLSFNVKLPQKLFNKNFLTQLINSNTFFEARAKVNYQWNELNKIYFHEMIWKYIDWIDLNSCNPELLSDLIIDYHFDKISYNVFLDIKELLRI